MTAGCTPAGSPTTRASSTCSSRRPSCSPPTAASRSTSASPATGRRRSAGTRSSTGSSSDERGADAAVVFDGGMVERDVPAFNIAVRGLCYFHVTVRAGNRDLHSGIYGGASLNAMHAIAQTLSAVMPREGWRAGGAAGGDRAAVSRRSSRAGKPAAGRGGDRGGRAPGLRTPRRGRSSTCAPGPSLRSTCTASTAARRPCRRP